MIVGELPVLPKHYWEGTGANGEPRDLGKSTLEVPLGSGPYRIKEVDAGPHASPTSASRTGGRRTCPSPRANGTSTRSGSSISATACRPSRPSRPGSSTTGARSSAKAWATAYDFDAVKRGLVKKERDRRSSASRRCRRSPSTSAARNSRTRACGRPSTSRSTSSGPTRTCSTTSTRGSTATSTTPS